MQAIGKRLEKLMRAAALLIISAVGILGTAANAQITYTQTNLIAPFPSGGLLSGDNPGGSTMAINSKGILVVATTYGNQVLQITAATGAAAAAPASSNGPAGVAIDSNDYLYVGSEYGNSIGRIPMNSDGTYTITDPTAGGLPTCKGGTSDTVECQLTPLTTSALSSFGVSALATDAAGDLFVVTDNTGSTAQYSIYECSTTCLYGSNPTAPMLLYTEGVQSPAAQNYVGSIALDSAGNVFFTDSTFTNLGRNWSTHSWVKEIPLTSGAYGAVKTLAAFTTPNPAEFDDEIDGVTADASGNVFFANQYSGVYELVNSGGTLGTTPVFISPQGAKTLTNDQKGNFYYVTNSNGSDTVGLLTINPAIVFAGSTYIGSPASAAVTVADSSENCGSATLVFSATEGGSPTTDFTGAAGSTCSAPDYATGASYPVTISFNPSVVGPVSGVFTTTDTASSVAGSINVSGTGAPTPTAQTITWNSLPSPVLQGQGPWTITATASSGLPVTVSIDKSTSPSGIAALTANQNGSYTLYATGAGSVVIDANQAGGTNSGTTYFPAPQLQQTITVTAVTSPTGGAPLIVTQTSFLTPFPTAKTNLSPNGSGVLSGGNPAGSSWGINSKGILVGSGTYGNFVLQANAATGAVASAVPTDTGQPNAISNPSGTAIDSNGYLYVGNMYGNNISRVPMNADGTYTIATDLNSVSGLPTCQGGTSDKAVCVITPLTKSAAGYFGTSAMVLDAAGDLFFSTDNAQNSSVQYSVYECPTTCLYGASPTAPVLLYQETVNPAAQNFIGQLAVDSTGNLFFTDSTISNLGSNYSTDSWVKEIPYTSGSGYGSPVTLVSFTTPSPHNYDDEIDAVAVDASGNVFFGNQMSGIYELVNSGGTLNTANPVFISSQGAKLLLPDGKGNLYLVANTNGADTIGFLSIGSVTVLPYTVPGNTVSVSNVLVTDSYVPCTSTPSFTFYFTDSEFTASVPSGSTCASPDYGTGSALPATFTFDPGTGATGAITDTVNVGDSTNGGTGTAAVTGYSTSLQAITGFTGVASSVAYGGGPYTISATGGGSGQPVIFTLDPATTGYTSSTASSVATLSGTNGTSLTITGTGKIVIDMNQAGGTNNGITYAAAPQATVTITVGAGAQTIHFTSPSSGTTAMAFGGSPITLAATGGPSGAPVVFTLDPSTQGYTEPTTSAVATLSGTNNSTLTITGVTTGSGEIVIDANQAASSDGKYAAAAQAQAILLVSPASQNITLTASAKSAVYPQSISFTAIGGSSGSPIELSITSGAGIATLAGNILTPTGTAFGPVTVIATQAASSGYSAAASQSVTVTFNSLGAVASPTFDPGAGSTLYQGVTNKVSIADATPNAAVYYTTDGSTPTTASAKYTGAITLAATSTVQAIAVETGYSSSAVQTASYTVSSLAPGFTATSSPGAVNLTPGGSAVIDISIAPNASFLGTVTFACSGAPAGVACAFSPASVTANGVNALTTVLTITDSASTSATRRGPNPFLPGGATFALALCFAGFRKRRSLVLGLVLLAGVLGVTQLMGCGGGGLSSTGSTTSAMTVTATSTYNGVTVTQTVPVTITLR